MIEKIKFTISPYLDFQLSKKIDYYNFTKKEKIQETLHCIGQPTIQLPALSTNKSVGGEVFLNKVTARPWNWLSWNSLQISLWGGLRSIYIGCSNKLNGKFKG